MVYHLAQGSIALQVIMFLFMFAVGLPEQAVPAGEMLVGPKKTLFMDEISTGLDSSTTFQIVKAMGDFVHLRQGTVLMSLLQPAPEVYNLFDDILLLSEGEL